jgi:hypothetical protein
MAGRLARHAEVAPKDRVINSREPTVIGYFYPREVASILEVPEIDYHQLRRLYELARSQAGQPIPKGWARFTLRDVAAIRVAIALTPGGTQAIQTPGRRLRLAPIEHACAALRALGVANPLLEVTLHLYGRSVVAEINGELFDPVSGQIALRGAYSTTSRFLLTRGIRDADLQARLRDERTSPGPSCRLRRIGELEL